MFLVGTVGIWGLLSVNGVHTGPHSGPHMGEVWGLAREASMATAPQGAYFEAVYEDGSAEEFFIDHYTLARGDHVRRIIARELQAKGELPPGRIADVRRSQTGRV